jgi:hypothetical protein|nr:MAG TPA: hypothetical protein [Caudoviricetes sp.]
MSLKSLIQWLLDSRTTPEEAGHSAMPSTSYITPTATAVQAWGQMAQGVAPFDGFVRASARASNTSSNIRVTNDTATVFAQSEGTATGQTQGVFVPVAKGDSWTVYGTNRDNVVVRLVKAIGGGYNLLIRRALSCLRPSFNFSQRSFFKVNIPTLLINADQVPVHKARQSQETARRTLWLLSPVGPSLRLAQTVRQTTHGLGLKTPPEELHTSPMQFANTKRLLSQCKKEIFLLLTSALITRTKALFCLSLLKQQNNFGTGGMTC